MVLAIFIVMSHLHALNIKAFLAVTRSTTYWELFCVHCFHSGLILGNLIPYLFRHPLFYLFIEYYLGFYKTVGLSSVSW